MNKKLLTLSLLSILLITSCGGSSDDDKDAIKYDLTFDSLILRDPDTGRSFDINYQLSYKDSYFDNSGSTLNKKLLPVSLGTTLIHPYKDKCTDFFTTTGYTDLYFSPDYDVPMTKDSSEFLFAHKQIGEYEMFAVGISGFAYGKQWINNLVWGKEGNASGFQVASDKVKASFLTYFNEHKKENNKLWVTGYSRSAAIADIFLEEILDDGLIPEDNLYSYLFEPPAVMVESTVKPHPAIRNIINHADAVVNALPSKFGFIRPGVDVDIYNSKADSIVRDFDSRLSLATFTPISGYFSDEKGCIKYLLNSLLAYDPKKEDVKDMATREHYVDNYQDSFEYAMTLAFSIKSSTQTYIMNSIANMSSSDISSLLSGDNLYLFLKGQLDTCQETYDDDKLHNTCSMLVYFVTTVNPSGLAFLYLNKDSIVNSVMRTVQFHGPEVELPLIIKYCK